MSRCVVITGHLGGIGSALVGHFETSGHAVIGIDQRRDPDASCAQIVADLGTLDDDAQQTKLKEALHAAIGNRPVLALINNAAVQHLGPIDSVDLGSYVESFKVNSLAPLILARLLLPHLARSHGAIINIGSIHSSLSKPGFSPYAVSKAALAGISRALALEVGSRVPVMEIRPAAVTTPMLEAGFAEDAAARRALDEYHPTQRIGEPAELARVVLQLATADAGYLNGAIVNVDGGISHRLHDPS